MKDVSIEFNFDEKLLRDESGKRIFRPKKFRDLEAEYAMILGTKSPKVNEALKKCEALLNKLSAHKHAIHFLQPVDYVTLNIPDYPLIVKEPMDLGTVKKKLKAKEYKNPLEMMKDIEKVWSNSFLYNPANTTMHSITMAINSYYQTLKGMIDNPFEDMSALVLRQTKSDIDHVYGIKIPYPGSMADRPLSYEDKRILTEMIKSNLKFNQT